MTTLNHTLYELTTNVDNYLFNVRAIRFTNGYLVTSIAIHPDSKERYKKVMAAIKRPMRVKAEEQVIAYLKKRGT